MDGFTLHERLEADTFEVAELTLCSLRLMNDARYPWLILVPRQKEIRELTDLSEAEQRQLFKESAIASRALDELFAPDKLNIGALGNVVSQFHWHVVARYQDDDAWPAPVWGFGEAQPYNEASATARITQLQHALAH